MTQSVGTTFNLYVDSVEQIDEPVLLRLHTLCRRSIADISELRQVETTEVQTEKVITRSQRKCNRQYNKLQMKRTGLG